MFVLFSAFFLFSVIGLLLLGYNLFIWGGAVSGPGGLRTWLSSFECGFCSGRVSECYFSYTYFILLVFFVVFDLEVSLLLNIPYGFCFLKNCVYYLSFLLILAVGYGLELLSGYIRWSY